MAYDLIRWASHIGLFLAVSLLFVFVLLDRKFSLFGFLLFMTTATLLFGCLVHAPDGRTWMQYWMSRALLSH